MTSLRGVWTGRDARTLSIGFLGVADQSMGFPFAAEGSVRERMLALCREDAYLDLVARHLGQQVGTLQRQRDGLK